MTGSRICMIAPAIVSALLALPPQALQAQATAPASPGDDVMIVFDGSNSMWGQIDGVAKIEIARDVMQNLLGDWTADRHVGLMAYGHRQRGDCGDIETLITPAPGMAGDIQARIDAITPTGKTPLTDAVEQAALALSYTDRPATVVLISDGLESCDRDPCALARTLEKGGVGFTAHVVGFGLGTGDAASLACIAEETGGRFIEAANAGELASALSTLGTAVAAAPVPEPEPEPEPETPQITLTAPDTALAGSKIRVAWTGAVSARDYVTVVAMGADEGSAGSYIRVNKDTDGTLQMPGDTGLYEIRYVLAEGKKTLARQTVEVTAPEVTVSAPDTALAGSKIKVAWTGAVSARDYVTVVAMGADEGSAGSYIRVEKDTDGTLQMPGDTGLYEIRYVLAEGKKTLARQTIEVTAPEVTVSAPDTALAGSKIKVAWTGAVSARDYVTVVAMGADEGSAGSYIRVEKDTDGTLQMPGDTGLYEIRYVLAEGKKTLARQTIEVTAPEVTVSAPAQIRAGEVMDITWTGAVDGRDYIRIAPLGSADDAKGDYLRVNDTSAGRMSAPDQPGMYELRYTLNAGARVLARHVVEVLAADATLNSGATLDAPERAAAGSTIDVGWSVGTASADQRITIAAEDQAIFTWITALPAADGPPVQLTLPDAPGVYELRFLDVSNQAVLARRVITVE